MDDRDPAAPIEIRDSDKITLDLTSNLDQEFLLFDRTARIRCSLYLITMASTAPATYTQSSRKGKKAWRKNIDITTVTAGLEDARAEIIATGGVIAEQPTDALFATDVVGDAEIERKQKRQKQLKVDEILAQRSAVPALDGRKRKAPDLPIASRKKAKDGKYVPHKDLQRLRNFADNALGGAQIAEGGAYDPWAETPAQRDERLSFLEAEKKKRAPATLAQAPVPLTKNAKAVPHVPKPEGGKSYNPLVTDWSALLAREGAAAVEAEKARLAAEALAAEAEARALAEAERVEKAEKDEYGTDYESAWESEWEGFQSGAEEETHVAKRSRRKTPQERKKVQARKEREAKEKREKQEKERREQEKRIAQIAREMSARDKARRPGSQVATVSDSSDDEAATVELQRRRFGQVPVPDAPLEVVLPDELEDSLRRLKPEGNLLSDRYRNLLINGKVEVRKKNWQWRQGKKERTEKWSYKDWKLK